MALSGNIVVDTVVAQGCRPVGKPMEITKCERNLLLEVDEWTGFSRQFTHLKSGEAAPDRSLLLTAILADAINLGLVKMAESCQLLS